MSIALRMIIDVGYVEEHPKLEKALNRNGLYGITVDEYLINMKLACRRRDLSKITSSQNLYKYDPGVCAHIVTGMDLARLSRAGGKSLWLKDNRLRNIVAGLDDVACFDKRNAEHSAGVNTHELLETAWVEGGTTAVKATILGLILAIFSGLILMPVEKIDPDKSPA